MTDPDVKPLLDWAVSHGAEIGDSIAFRRSANCGISAFAKNKIDPSKPNFSIPIELTLNPKQAKEFFGVDFAKAKDLNSVTKLFLNFQRSLKSDSFWFNYVNLLPEGNDIGSPLYWSSNEKKLLTGTNLGSSLSEYFENIVEEWYDAVQWIPAKLRDDKFDENLKFYQLYKDGKIDDSSLEELINHYTLEEWTSFPCYLWATAIFKSRSFPYVLIDEKADPKYSLLLPVIDLLNHDPSAYVSWALDETKTKFIMNNNASSLLNAGDELFNNYGGKGNEELLLGYGFVLEDNKNDSLALRIKVPLELLPEIENFGIRLPRLEDYTISKYSLETVTNTVLNYKDYEQGLLYYCNQENLVPKNLLNLFSYLVRNDIEARMSLRMRLQGLDSLRNAIQAKQKTLKTVEPITVNSERARMAAIYRKGQESLLAKVIAEAKDQEKRILKDQKQKVWDLRKILKKDQLFANSLLLTFGLLDAESIEEQGLEDHVFLLWLVRCYNRQQEDFLPEWIQTLFVEFVNKVPVTHNDETAVEELYHYLFPALSKKIPEIYAQGEWGVKELALSGKLLQFISYNRGVNRNTILVEPVSIAL